MKSLHTFTGALALSAALIGAPSPGLAQVSDTTRAKIEKLVAEDPAFDKQLRKFHRDCLAGTNPDPRCDELLIARHDIYLKEKALAADKQALAESKQETAAIKKAVEAKEQAVAAKEQLNAAGELSVALVQLGNYVTGGILPAANQDLIAKVGSNPNASQELREFMTRVRANPRIGKADRERLLGYLKASMDSYRTTFASAPESVRNDYRFKSELADFGPMYSSLAQSLAKMW